MGEYRARKTLWGVALVCGLTLSSCGSLLTEIQDHSDFTNFKWTTASCEDELFFGFSSLEVTLNDDGTYTIRTAVLVDGSETQVLEADLGTSELGLLLDLFGAVEVLLAADGICGVVDRPDCGIQLYEWDAFALENWICNAPRISNTESKRINDLLKTIRPREGGETTD